MGDRLEIETMGHALKGSGGGGGCVIGRGLGHGWEVEEGLSGMSTAEAPAPGTRNKTASWALEPDRGIISQSACNNAPKVLLRPNSCL